MKVSAEIRTYNSDYDVNVIFNGEGTFENGILSTDFMTINTKEMSRIHNDVNGNPLDNSYLYIREVSDSDYSDFIFVKDFEDSAFVVVITPILLNSARASLDAFMRSRGIESEDIVLPYASPVYLYDTFDALCTSYMEYFKEDGKAEDMEAFKKWISGWKSIIEAMGDTL